MRRPRGLVATCIASLAISQLVLYLVGFVGGISVGTVMFFYVFGWLVGAPPVRWWVWVLQRLGDDE